MGTTCARYWCVPAVLFAWVIPGNITLGDLHNLVLVLQVIAYTIGAFVLTFLTRSALRLVARGLYKHTVRMVVLQVVRTYVLLHPRISNARVRSMQRSALRKVRAWLRNTRGVKLVFAVVTLLGAAVGLGMFMAWVGFVRVLHVLTRPIVDRLARTFVGTAVMLAGRKAALLLERYARQPYMRGRSFYRRHNMRLLRRLTRTYRKRVHRRRIPEHD